MSSPVEHELVGRADELARLRGVVRGGEEGIAAVLLGGDAGMGKTRLVSELADDFDPDDVLVVTGSCIHTAYASLPYVAISEALRSMWVAAGLSSDDLPVHVRTELGTLVPEVEPERGTSDPAQEGRTALRLFDAVASFLAIVARRRRLCVVIEDLHWADPSTRELFVFLVHNVEPGQVALLGTYRTDEMSRSHPLRPMLVELDRSPRVLHLTLAPLDRSELGRFAAARLGEPPPARVLDEVADRSGGNPFYAAELFDAIERGETTVRPELEDLIVARAESLSEVARALLQVAAVGGESVSDEVLEEVLGEDDVRLSALPEVIDARVCVVGTDGRLRFRHALMQEAIYRSVLPGERRRIHARYAAALEQRPDLAATLVGASAELAWHLREAREVEAAVQASMDATRAAEGVLAFAEALGHVETVLDLWDDLADPERATGTTHLDLLESAGRLARDAGDFLRGARYLRAAISAADAEPPATQALLHVSLGRCLQAGGKPDAALSAYERAVELVPAEPSAARAVVLAGYGQQLMLAIRYDEGKAAVSEAAEMARLVGERLTEGHARNSLGSILLHDGEYEEGCRLLAEAEDIATEVGDGVERSRAIVNLVSGLSMIGDLHEAERRAVAGLDLARQLGLESSSGFFIAANRFEILCELGRWAEADSFAAELRRPEGHLPRRWLAPARADRAIRTGDLEAAREVIDGGELDTSAFDPQLAAEHWAQRADIAFLLGDDDAGRTALQHGLAAPGTRLQQLGLHARAIDRYAGSADPADRARVDAHLAEVERLAALLDGQPDAPLHRARAWIAEARARAATDPAEVAIRFGEAAEHWALGGFAWQPIAARVRGGEALWQTADRSAARSELAAAAEAARRLGATPLVERAGRIIGGEHTSSEVADAGLTARERDVVRLIAAGRTNGQIGEGLFISPKTVSVHVSRILHKLGVDNRTAAAAEARRLGLVPDL
ncbi:MAG: AAA family ATPase [Actinomycetota bacterium]